MDEQIRKQKAREKWLKIYEETGSVTVTCNRCGIARTTLYRWIKRFKQSGFQGLSDESKRPPKYGNQKLENETEQLILQLRQRKWGPQRISNYLKRTKGYSLSAIFILAYHLKHPK